MRDVVREQVTTTEQAPGSVPVQDAKSYRIEQILSYVLWVIEVILAFRLVLKLFGANPVSSFVSFVYTLSSPFVAPFVGIFPSLADQRVGAVVEWSTLVAMAVYAIVIYGIEALIAMIGTRNQPNVHQETAAKTEERDTHQL